MMDNQTIKLLSCKRFLPLFLTQTLGALNDNIFKNALVILITYVLAKKSGLSAPLVITLASGLFILPFFLFSAFAGQLADKYDKAWLIRHVKEAEILVMLMAGLGFQFENTYLLLFILFLMGVQSSFFGPLKYGILPDHLTKDELLCGNGLIQGVTFLAILFGTVLGGLFILKDGGVMLITWVIMFISIAGWFSARFIPPATPADATNQFSLNIFKETYLLVRSGFSRPDLILTILAISWFWFVGATLLAQLPIYGKEVLQGDPEVVTLLLLVFSMGIALGSVFCTALLKGKVSIKYVPWGALGIAVFGIDLYFATLSLGVSREMLNVSQLLGSIEHWRVLVDLLCIAIFGGIYIVPLNTSLQFRSPKTHRARFIAINNISNALFMVASAIFSGLIYTQGYGVSDVFLWVSLACLVMVFVTDFLTKKIDVD